MQRPLTTAERLELGLAEAGFEMMRQTLRRRFPEDDDEAHERRFLAWLRGPGRWPTKQPWRTRTS